MNSRLSGIKAKVFGELIPHQNRQNWAILLVFTSFHRKYEVRRTDAFFGRGKKEINYEAGWITWWLYAWWGDHPSCSEGAVDLCATEDDAKSKFEKKIEIKASDNVDSSRFLVASHNNINSVPIIVPGRKHPSTAVRTTDFKMTFLSTLFITLAIMKSKCLTVRIIFRVLPVTPWATFYTPVLTFSISRWLNEWIIRFLTGMWFVTDRTLTNL